MVTMPNKKEREGLLRRYLSGMSFPKLFLLLAGLFALDLVMPDPVPFVDEAVLGILAIMVGMIRDRRKSSPSATGNGEPRAAQSERAQLGD